MKDRIEKIEIEGENKSGDIFGIWGSAWKEMRGIRLVFTCSWKRGKSWKDSFHSLVFIKEFWNFWNC